MKSFVKFFGLNLDNAKFLTNKLRIKKLIKGKLCSKGIRITTFLF